MKFDSKSFVESFFAEVGYNADSLYHTDANVSAIFGRQLEDAIAESFNVIYLQSEWRRFMPQRKVNSGAELVSYKQFDWQGEAEFVDAMADDFPSVEIKGAQFYSTLASVGASYNYSVQDVRAAQMAGLPLDTMKATAAREAVERKIDKVMAYGDADHNLTGLANAPNVPVFTVGGGTNTPSGVKWAGSGTVATALQVFQDVAGIASTISTNTKGIFTADTLLLPLVLFNALNSTLFQPTFNTKTVLQALKEANPWIKNIEVWQRLDIAGAGGIPRAIMYKKDPKVAEAIVAQDFETFPPQVKNMKMQVICHARIGGVQVRYPTAMAYIDGLYAA